ncbi:MAG: metalloenzyme [Anaerolineae bacterium]|nr:metalloenzyme [Anaerolineae bacterium]
MGRVCFVFLDGVGLGPNDGTNPLAVAPMPHVRDLLGGGLVTGREVRQANLLFRPLDACLGVEGLPQSGTGQTALFTGVNAAAVAGMHIAAYPTADLRAIIEKDSLLKRAKEMGKEATFANAYSDRYWELVAERKLRHSATTLINMAAALRFRTLADLKRGEALYWDIVHLALRERVGPEWPLLAPEEAGRRLGNLAAAHDLVLYESFLPDLVGHRRIPLALTYLLDLIDRFLGSLLQSLDGDVSLVLCSDHGNIEDPGTKGHTYNPVPLLVVGTAAHHFGAANAITDVTPAILNALADGSGSP